MSRGDNIIKNMIAREIQDELIRNITLDFNKLDRNIEKNLKTQLLGVFGTRNNKKAIKQKTLIQEYSILKWGKKWVEIL